MDSTDEVSEISSNRFTIFPRLPAELRAKVWQAAITPRVIRCQRTNDENLFTAPPKSVTLFEVSRESRNIAFLYGGFILLSTTPCYIYFSPKIDYLLFDVGWKSLADPPQYPRLNAALAAPATPPKVPQDFIVSLEAIDPALKMLRNIMVHPNWNDQRMMPTVPLARLPYLERVLVASDEKSIGLRSEVMFSTVHDIKMYYGITRKTAPEVTTPRIAVGCLGWTGKDRWTMHHGRHDNRQLVAVFQDYAAMKEHQRLLQEEEKRFTEERFGPRTPSFMVKLRQAREAHSTEPKPISILPDIKSLQKPPTYEEATSADTPLKE
ncbi:hypothetical protein LHYA1_G006332 [Lachnellula hyalina]|uniref:2EXR domain-containing protein n=1 Tax=Lachnellula hyalina TaxID=1316788 RepID=A0A8H8R2D5_9HELO|nr:uncharacterized protein LHYA1_G006332 [Lachnellula hyalina]TVY25624.1 hypothetical protein LHYA1_G006332 [Lachnellula hyalina]